MQGWIKLHRKIVDWEWYDDIPTFKLFIHLLLKANHEDNKWRGQTIEKGSFVTSLASLSTETGLSIKQIRTALKHLENTGEIDKQTTNQNTLIIVLNYGIYQEVQDQNGKQGANKGQSDGKQGATNKNDKNDKNVRSEEVVVCFANRDKLSKIYPAIDWEAYEQDDFVLKPSNIKAGKGVVILSTVQEDLLLDKLDIEMFNYYISKLADFIIRKNTMVKNHYATILKWYREDTGISEG
jgi:hypothetical protein